MNDNAGLNQLGLGPYWTQILFEEQFRNKQTALKTDVEFAEKRLAAAIKYGIISEKTLRRYRRECRQAEAALAAFIMSQP